MKINFDFLMHKQMQFYYSLQKIITTYNINIFLIK